MEFAVLIFILLVIYFSLQLSALKKEAAQVESKLEGLENFFDETEIVEYATVNDLEKLADRLEQLELGDFPRFDDKLTEGLQNLLDYSIEAAREGRVSGDR